MKNKTTGSHLANLGTKGALIAIVAQLTFGSIVVSAANEQPLMNTALPLPDVKVQHSVARSVTNTPGATAVALRFFGKKPEQAVGVGTTAGITTKLPEVETKSETKVEAKAEPKLEPRLEPTLETNSSWLEEGTTKTPTTAATTTSIAPTNAPVLRDAIEVPATVEEAADKAESVLPVATTVAAPIEATVSTESENQVGSAGQITFTSPLNVKEPVKPTESMALLPGLPAPAPMQTHQVGAFQAPLFIDNDEIIQQKASIEYEELPLDDETKTKVKAGARFPIVITSEVNSRTAKKGDAVHGRLKYDLKIADRLVAKKGSVVRGHLNYALKARTPMGSLVSLNRWYRNSGCLGVHFDEIINEKNEHIPLVAEPARQALYVKNKGEGRVLGINHKGQIVGPWSQQLRYKAIRVGMNFAMAPLGTMSFGAMPVALGVIGAINPSFAFMKPVGLNVRHRRLKGFAWGFLSGVPGSWLIEDTTVKGQEAIIKPGDEFLAEIREEFTGEPATDAEMLGGANTKVQGEVVGTKGGIFKNKKKK